MEYLFDPLIGRHQSAQAEDHHRDDKDPEIELQPIAEGVLRVGRLVGAAHAEKQQELVPGVDRRMDRFAVHGRAADDQRRPNLQIAIATLPAIAAMMTRSEPECSATIPPPLRRRYVITTCWSLLGVAFARR